MAWEPLMDKNPPLAEIAGEEWVGDGVWFLGGSLFLRGPLWMLGVIVLSVAEIIFVTEL